MTSIIHMKNRLPNLFSKKRIYGAIFICLLIIGWMYWRELDTSSTTLNDLSWTKITLLYLGIGLLFMAMRDFAYMVRIRILTEQKLSWKQAFNVIMMWEFASAISPGVVGGSAVAVFILEKEKIPLAESTTLVITTLILDNLFYILAIPIVWFSLSHNTLFPESMASLSANGMVIFWIGYSILVFINLILVASIFYSPKLIGGLVNLLFRLPFLKKRKAAGDRYVAEIKTASANLKRKRTLFWIKLMVTTIWSWTSRFLVVNLVLAAFIPIGFGDNLLILARQLIMWLGMLVTPTPGGSGMAEIAFSSLFEDYIGSIGASAIALALIWRTLSYYPYLFVGLLILPRWLKKSNP